MGCSVAICAQRNTASCFLQLTGSTLVFSPGANPTLPELRGKSCSGGQQHSSVCWGVQNSSLPSPRILRGHTRPDSSFPADETHPGPRVPAAATLRPPGRDATPHEAGKRARHPAPHTALGTHGPLKAPRHPPEPGTGRRDRTGRRDGTARTVLPAPAALTQHGGL